MARIGFSRWKIKIEKFFPLRWVRTHVQKIYDIYEVSSMENYSIVTRFSRLFRFGLRSNRDFEMIFFGFKCLSLEWLRDNAQALSRTVIFCEPWSSWKSTKQINEKFERNWMKFYGIHRCRRCVRKITFYFVIYENCSSLSLWNHFFGCFSSSQ